MSTQTEPDLVHVTSKKGTPTWEIAHLYPEQGRWTEAAYLALDTNRLIELSDGCLEFLPMPTLFHQRLIAFVYRQFCEHVLHNKLGEVHFAPLRVRTVPGTFREPDVVFVKPERIRNPHVSLDGADLVVEIVSPGEDARNRNLEVKREEYARAGISEYWIIDPETETVTVLALEGESYREHGAFAKGQIADSVLLSGFALEVSALFSAGQTGESHS